MKLTKFEIEYLAENLSSELGDFLCDMDKDIFYSKQFIILMLIKILNEEKSNPKFPDADINHIKGKCVHKFKIATLSGYYCNNDIPENDLELCSFHQKEKEMKYS